MIISASRRTDIPAFFGKNFFDSLINGTFKIVNPFNRKVSYLTFQQSDIDGIVFWSKNPKPFFPYLREIKDRGFQFYFQFTLNNYPEKIEPYLANIKERIDIFNELATIIKPYKIIWRYDPIILSSNFNKDFHKENFEMILSQINENTYKITVSIVTMYRKIKKFFPNIEKNKKQEEAIIKELNLIAKNYGKIVTTCCYKVAGIESAKCVDGKIFNPKLAVKKHYGQRAQCRCDKSVDIGEYGTCKYRCLYCYAR